MKILAIETSCDDTCAAVLNNDRVLSSVVSTQISFHKKFGGVVPNIAKEKHKEFIDPCVAKALKQAGVAMKDIDVLAVTYGPGLAVALEVGIAKIKELAKEYNKPVIAVNHLEGHLLSPFLKNSEGRIYSNIKPKFPFISLIISGGHTELVLVEAIGKYKLIGQTLDDAAGEAFDKVARLLKLGYPGGPLISKVAETGDRKRYDLVRPMIRSKDFNFSFSGLKTACLLSLRKIYASKSAKHDGEIISFSTTSDYFDSTKMFFTKKEISDFAASFQEAVADVLVTKLARAVAKYNVKHVSIGGGVCANLHIRKRIRQQFEKTGIDVAMPKTRFCTDNAGMIGIVAYHKAKRCEFLKDVMKLDRDPILNFK